MRRYLAFFLSLFMLSSCATLFAQDTRSVVVTSQPPGAQIFVNGVSHGTTPTRIIADDHSRLVVTIQKEGFHSAGCFVNTQIRAIWLIGDLLLFYTIFPLVIDLVTDNWSSLSSEFCTVNLTPISGPPPPAAAPPAAPGV